MDIAPENERQIDVNLFREHLQIKFSRLLDKITKDKTKPKDIVLIDSIKPLFTLIVEVKEMKERNVNILWLKNDLMERYDDIEVEHLIFLVPPRPDVVRKVGQFLRVLKNKNIMKENSIIFYPKRTILCKHFMESEDIHPFFENRIYDYNFDLIPLSDDLLSLEYPLGISELYETNEFNVHNLAAESLQRIQLVFGKIPTFLVKGDNAAIVYRVLRRLEKEHSVRLKYEGDLQEIDACIILDRGVDLLTPLCTQLTYQGLVDERLKLDCNTSILDSKIPDLEGKKEGLVSFEFKGEIFDEIKDKNMSIIGKYLQQKLMTYQELVRNRENIKDVSQAQMIASEIRKKKSIEPHVNIAFHIDSILKNPVIKESLRFEQECLMGSHSGDDVIKHVMRLILAKAPLTDVYRALCIQSFSESGLKAKHYESARNSLIETYGLSQIVTLQNLEKLSMLFNRDTNKHKTVFNGLKKELRLLDFDVDKIDMMTTSVPYSMYVPLTTRLIELALREKWARMDLVEKLHGGETIVDGDRENVAASPTKKKVVLVYVVGGLTYGEIAGIRELSKKLNTEILVAVTNIVDYNRMLSPLIAN